MNFSAFTNQLKGGLDQMKLAVSEKLIHVDPDCQTQLPEAYVQLEARLGKVKQLYETMLRLGNQFTVRDYDPSLDESAKEVFGKLNQAGQSLVRGGEPVSAQGDEALPKTFAHALARASSSGALALGENEPLGAGFRKYAAAQDKLGEARLKLESDVRDNFLRPWSATLNNNISFALKAQKQLLAVKHAFDVSKMKMKTAKPDKLGQSQLDMQKAEEEYNAALADATDKVKLVVDSPEPLRNLSELVSAQLAYFKAGADALGELQPEIDEMQVTQEALFRGN